MLSLVTKSYLYTTITSVMLLQQCAIPAALLLSIVFLKIKYKWNHYVAIFMCVCGFACSFVNDIVIYPQDQDQDNFTLKAFYGDLMVFGGGILYAT